MSAKEVSRQTKVLYSSSKGKANLLGVLNENNDQYLERMAALKNFRSKSKKMSAVRTQLQDWSEEQLDLMKALDKCEKNKSSQMQVIILGGVDVSTIQAFLNEEEALAVSRSQLRTTYRNQIEQTKKFLADQIKQMNKLRNPVVNGGRTKGNNEENATDEDSPVRKQQATVIFGVCADVFLQLRGKFHDTWMALKEEESLYRREVNSFAAQMQQMIRDDTVEFQNNQLHLEILAMVRTSEQRIVSAEVPAEVDDVSKSIGSTNSTLLPTTTKAVDALIAIPDDDPELLNLIADVTQQLQSIDDETHALASKKAAELHQLLIDLEIQQADNDMIGSEVKENMYESLEAEDSDAILEKQPSLPPSEGSTQKRTKPTVHLIGGWSQSEHDTFVKIYRNAELKGIKRSKMLEQLQLALSSNFSKSSEDILVHEEWYRKSRLIQKKYKDTEQSLQVQRQDAIIQAKQRIEQFIRDFRTKYNTEQELQRQEEHRQRLHAELDRLREDRRRTYEEQLQALAVTEEEERLKIQHKLQQEEEERRQKKQLVEEYQRQKASMEAEKLKRRQEEQAEAQARLQALILQNKSRVEYRAQQEAQKIQHKKQREEEELQQEAKRIELLLALAAQVPYYETIQQIESRLDHVTASAKAQEYVPISEDDRLTRGHLPLNSFNDHQIVRDARFRLSEALARAGIQHSDAARYAVTKMNPRPHLAIHGLL